MNKALETILNATLAAEIKERHMLVFANITLHQNGAEEKVDEDFLVRLRKSHDEIYKLIIPHALPFVAEYITNFEADELLHLDYEAEKGMIDRAEWGEYEKGQTGMMFYYKNGSVRIFPYDRHDEKYYEQDMINYYGSREAWQAYEKERQKAQAEFDRLKDRGAGDEEMQAAAERFRKTLARSAFAPQ